MVRLDQKVSESILGLSRTSAAKLIEQSMVKVNGKVVIKPSYVLKNEDKIKVNYDISTQTPPPITLPIIYEDEVCVVVNKPIGILTHSKGLFNPEPTVASWLQPRLKGLGGDRGGIVHRLDRATSGIMICAKTPEALGWLQKQFSTRKVKKTYLAIVSGKPKKHEAIIDMPIERNVKKPSTFRVGVNGKPAKTFYKVLSGNSHYSLLRLIPETGRTHQLRVHLKHIGNPVLGDKVYGGDPAERLYLHALSLDIILPNHQHKIFLTDAPEDFTRIFKEARDV